MTESIDQWLSEATNEEIPVPVCFNRALLAEFEACVLEHQQLVERRKNSRKLFGEAGGLMHEDREDDTVAQRLTELHEAIEQDKAKHTFIICKFPYDEFRLVLEAHPPTPEQRAQSPFLDHNPDAAAPELVAASCKHPAMTVEHARAVRESLPEHEWGKLYEAAMRVNRTGVVIPKGVSSTVERLASELKSTTPAPEASPSASSEDGQ